MEIKGVQLPNPFPRLTYAEAMSKYGSDRPDTRFDLHLKEVNHLLSLVYLGITAHFTIRHFTRTSRATCKLLKNVFL